MSEINKSYRIRTDVGIQDYITLNADLVQDYDTFEVLSVKINSDEAYKLHNSNYGVVAGRVLANNGFGVPNAKLSIFISADYDDKRDIESIYPFTTSMSRDYKGVRYNLLPDEKTGDCHQVVGSFPNKRYALDNDVVLEVFDKYYKFTTRTNNSGDYIICGVPTGSHTLHMDLDLSDCGILSQRPRDFVYKGYTIEQFENPNMFKSGTNYDNLSQIFTQDQVLNVNPFWGNDSLGETIGITRADINIPFKFEPTCVFIGSIVSDNSSQGISKKCIPTGHMGDMDELVTGEGRIEMIRKTPGGAVEEFQVKGNELINADGVWCYQIPMNLDYMMTDEYGNMVPTNDPEKGIPTRASVRFRISMQDNEENVDNYFRAKVLVPHNPTDIYEYYDYEFGTFTKDDSFRDLFWNNVYSVKSYIPRFQRARANGFRDDKFTGIKHCNYFGQNNPMPYNNIRIKLPLMFTIVCAIIKAFIFVVSLVNSISVTIFHAVASLVNTRFFAKKIKKKLYERLKKYKLNVLMDGLCPDLETWYFAPTLKEETDFAFMFTHSNVNEINDTTINLLQNTLNYIEEQSNDSATDMDTQSIDVQNKEEVEPFCLTNKTDYLISCIEMNLAQEYKVINFDFYNDWVNGTIYIPRWMRQVKPKTRFLWINWRKQEKIKGCMDDTKIFAKTRRYTQQCSIGYKEQTTGKYKTYTNVDNPLAGVGNKKKKIRKNNKYHKKQGFKGFTIFGNNGGICHKSVNLNKQSIYYLKPCEFSSGKKVNLFATDIILLGSLNDCDQNGLPKSFKHITSSSYIMPTNLALTNMETNGYLYAKDDDGTMCTSTHYATDAPEVFEEFSDCLSSQLTEGDYATLDLETGTTGAALYTVALAYAYSHGNEDDDLAEKIIDCFYDALSGYVSTTAFQEIRKTGGKRLYEELMLYKSYNEGTGTETYDVNFDENENSDTIAMTEAAGIAWNYTGPGQGDINEEKMYYPGGHFLGLSCVNSQSNLKSCINLSRICENGVNMSQRKEDVYNVDNDGNLEIRYTVPSGFISGNDIVDTDFRSMFATMNSKKLIAKKINPKTGYKFYDFLFSSQHNFDGSFHKLTGTNTPYNQLIEDIEDESALLNEGFGINPSSEVPDYDAGEVTNTQTKTNEALNVDYYVYRFGLDYNDVKSFSAKQKSKFLCFSGNTRYLPQYENSYYFYFGLHFGSTAIDEFNKQFFSECDVVSIKKQPSIKLYTDVDFCAGKGDINVVTSNLETPYTSIKYYENSNPNEIFEDYAHLNDEVFTISNLDFGIYTVKIVDLNGVEVSATASIGIDMVRYEYEVIDFNRPIDENGTSAAGSIFRGGYITLSDISIEGFRRNDFDSLKFKVYEGNTLEKTKNITDLDSSYTIYMKKARTEYTVKFEYKCVGKETREFTLLSFTLGDNSELQLKYGLDGIYTRNAMSDSNAMVHQYKTYWWANENYNIGAGNSNGDVGNNDTERKWLYRKVFFKETPEKINGETFRSEVFAVNGEKVLWGSPQNRLNVKDALYLAGDVFNIPHGFTVDDSASYHSTYGRMHCDYNIATPTTSDTRNSLEESGNCVMQYCAQVYNDEKAHYYYYGIKSGDTIVFTEDQKKYYSDGYGCVFKPVPSGDLKFIIYDSSDNYANMLDELSSYEYGIFYPSFIYPVIKRPFYMDTSLVIWEGFSFNNAPEHNEFIMSEEGGINEVKIHNGITYNGKFSTITVNSNEITQYVAKSDTSGLTLTESKDRIVLLNNNTPDMPTDSTRMIVSVTNGYPSNCSNYPKNTITSNSSPNFAKEMFYQAEDVGIPGDPKLKLLNYYVPQNDGDANIRYYIINAPITDFDLITKYYGYDEPEYSFYYKEFGLDMLIPGEFRHGFYILMNHKHDGFDEYKTMKVIMIRKQRNQYGDPGFYAEFNVYFDRNSDTVDVSTTLEWFDAGWDGYMETFKEFMYRLKAGTISGMNNITPVTKLDINVPTLPSLPNGYEMFHEYFAKLVSKRYLVDNNYLQSHNYVCEVDHNILAGIGVYDNHEEYGNNKVYKIYNKILRNYTNIHNEGYGIRIVNIEAFDTSIDAHVLTACSNTFDFVVRIEAEEDCTVSLSVSPGESFITGWGYGMQRQLTQGINNCDFTGSYNPNEQRSMMLSFNIVGGNVTRKLNVIQEAPVGEVHLTGVTISEPMGDYNTRYSIRIRHNNTFNNGETGKLVVGYHQEYRYYYEPDTLHQGGYGSSIVTFSNEAIDIPVIDETKPNNAYLEFRYVIDNIIVDEYRNGCEEIILHIE